MDDRSYTKNTGNTPKADYEGIAIGQNPKFDMAITLGLSQETEAV
ncbi:hypothetical protein [Nostoc sp. TCL26-01]|nr:hypothetical protein [Nostoc sp. TCL26-01]